MEVPAEKEWKAKEIECNVHITQETVDGMVYKETNIVSWVKNRFPFKLQRWAKLNGTLPISFSPGNAFALPLSNFVKKVKSREFGSELRKKSKTFVRTWPLNTLRFFSRVKWQTVRRMKKRTKTMTVCDAVADNVGLDTGGKLWITNRTKRKIEKRIIFLTFYFVFSIICIFLSHIIVFFKIWIFCMTYFIVND